LDWVDSVAFHRISSKFDEFVNPVREHGRVDVFVNNTGVHLVAPLAEVLMQSFHQVFDTNVYGTTGKIFFFWLEWTKWNLILLLRVFIYT
jgi:NAD(P)-dependent dehydrogenase (short-subunit alcohol dehydrogenase family)